MKLKTNAGNSRRSFLKKAAIAGLALEALAPAIKTEAHLQDGESDGMTILFQGDSITDGNRGRSEDPNHIMGHGYAFSIASRVGADFPSMHLKFINKGISGNKVTDLAARWQDDALDLKPNVLSILIGVNDAASVVNKGNNAVDFDLYEQTYTSLLDQAKIAMPDILFVLGQPFILPVGKVKDNWSAWESDLAKRSAIVERLAGKYNAVYVRNQQVFDAGTKRAAADYWIWDGIHPTVAGHELMAREWIKQAAKKLPFLKHYHY